MSKMNIELLRTIRRIQITTTRLAENILAGTYHSAYKGKGIEFEEVREYLPGDDVRSIDWNVTARFGHPYIKNFREERELTVMLLVDLSSSCRFGSRQHPKNQIIAEIAALLAFAAIGNNDKVGLLTFTDKIETYLSPKRGKKHVLRIIRELLVAPSINHSTNLAKALTFLGRIQRQQAICFIISDFLTPDFSHALKILSKRHDVTAIAITDPSEASFPNVGLTEVADLETGQSNLIDAGDTNLQMAIRQRFEKYHLELKKLMSQVDGGYVAISTDSSYPHALNQFFKTRSKHRR